MVLHVPCEYGQGLLADSKAINFEKYDSRTHGLRITFDKLHSSLSLRFHIYKITSTFILINKIR